ncbi:MAG: hypothetical protein DMD96_00900 [Candidatus Rokuibacteriota bacterium]|nr:MAG: hypothetical protein DMD96_00900 [Candidatus Rokubacteria bacterium]
MVAITVTNHAGDGHRQNLFSIRVPELAFTAGLPVGLALECAEGDGLPNDVPSMSMYTMACGHTRPIHPDR